MTRCMTLAGSLFFTAGLALGAPREAIRGIARPGPAVPAEARAQAAIDAPPQLDAEGCVPTPIPCNDITIGRLSPGDCTADGGKSVDFLQFQGRAGDYVEATIRALSPSLTRPLIGFLAPASDTAARTPLIYGGSGGATAGFVLQSTGTWAVVAGTDDVAASGDYAVELTCQRDSDPAVPHNCFAQPLLCNQTARWELTKDSCIWDDHSGYFDDFVISGLGGDVLTIEATGNGFTPAFGIYAQDGSQLDSSKLSGTTAKASFFVPITGDYHIAVTSRERLALGPFTLTVSCANSGCLRPVILEREHSADVVVPAGERATLRAGGNFFGDVQYEWYDAEDYHTVLGRGVTFQTPPVTSRHIYQYLVKTRCGQSLSNLFFVHPGNVRHRSVRH